MDFENTASLISEGFCQPITITELRADNYQQCKHIPSVPGVYLTLYTSGEPQPKFLPESPGGHFNGKNPTVSEDTLRENWVERALVVYIGKSTSLRTRIRKYLKYGVGIPIDHQGGRYIWQLSESVNLLITWKLTPNENPRDVEKNLIREFKGKYGKRPFANLDD